MKWIDTADLRNWANRRDCQESLPLLVRKLIRATSTSIENIKFPSGENVLIGGWDGILQVKTGTEYIPSGTSLWEFGANSDVKGKADDDYAKRTTDPIGFNPAESTFIFVTPRLWTKADEWIAEKKKDGIWKDIKVINAEKLEEWLETAPTVGAWLSIQHFGKYPAPVQSVEDFWDEWSTGKNIQLNHQLLLGGRENEVKKIIKLSEKPLVIPVQSLTREEALNFIISALKNNPEEEEDFNARTLIIGDVETFRKVSINANPLILIPRFEDEGIFNKAVSKGHTVIVPLGIDSSESWNGKILLPPIERESFVNSLVQSGIKKDIAEKYSKESARNITILRRQLEFKRNIPEWAKPENVRDIIPALIVGRWDENYEKDKEIVAKIAGVSYDEYSKKLKRWQFSSDSPIVKIGSKWRLASPLDSWTNASKFLTQNDFVLLQDSFLEILNEINPAFELEPKERYMASFHGKNRQYSSWIREGITQSLILVSVFGSKLSFDLPVSGISGEVWVDTIVSKLLDTDNPFLWKSTEGVLPLIAEASPREFLNKVDKYLNIDKSPVAALFEEEPGFLSNHSYHTGLLWALENLAWMPEYLTRSALVLAKLAFIDPDGNLSNRPKNSLTEIFKPWHYQTLAKLETRLETLKLITEKEKDVAWNLLLGMIPSFNGVGFPTHQMRWRLFNESTRLQYFYDEIDRTHTTVIDLLISIFDYTEEKLADLVDKSDEIRLSYENREKMRAFIQSVSEKVERKENKVWKAIGKVLSSHRSISDAQWALPETELIKYDELYKLFEPTDEIEKNVWLFEENWPSFPEGLKRKDVPYDEIQKIIDEKRIEAIKKIHRKYGVEKAKELSKQVKEDWIFGKTLAHIIDKENEVLSICQMLKDEKNNLRFFLRIYF
jgi:hypothetical protein